MSDAAASHLDPLNTYAALTLVEGTVTERVAALRLFFFAADTLVTTKLQLVKVPDVDVCVK